MRVDLFCRVVDNFGDIGVCWRLARQLTALGWPVRLWVDDLSSFARLEGRLSSRLPAQIIDGVDIIHWTQPAPDLTPHDVVIEAFACDPPPAFVHRMQDMLQRPVWLNLEYLSAEPWIDTCHGLPSPQPNGLVKTFFFPGFTDSSGGLLREAGLLAERDALQADPEAQARFLARIGVPARRPASGVERSPEQVPHERLVTLFCYPDAPASVLARELAGAADPSLLVIPDGVAPYLAAGQHGNVRIARIPFVAPADFDRLLWCADLNFVRGEDSFVRAQWAGRPMVWHIYPQDDAVHVDKLSAWLDRCALPSHAHDIHLGWNGETTREDFADQLRYALQPGPWAIWAGRARAWSDTLAAQTDLAGRLMAVCNASRR